MEKRKVNQLVSQLRFFQTTGRSLPALEECETTNGKVDYELMMARIIVEPQLAFAFNANLDLKHQRVHYTVPSKKMKEDLNNGKLSAIAIVTCGLSPKYFKLFIKQLKNEEDKSFFWRHYLLFKEGWKKAS